MVGQNLSANPGRRRPADVPGQHVRKADPRPPTASPAPSSPTTASPSRSTTPTPAASRSRCTPREVVAVGREHDDLPWLLFLQGGPGNRSPRPEGRGGWLGRALDGYRVLLLDQRGTGRSTPANRQTLPRRGDAAAQADYLAQFRADSIVRDAELIRRALLGEDEKWSVLGQSYGGFCTLTYLSYAPEGLREAFVTGGLAGLRSTATDVYRAAYPRVQRKVEAHYARYPDDVETVRAVVRHLREREVRLPGGGLLTAEAFHTLGNMLGTSSGSHTLHYLLEDAFLAGDELSDTFLAQVQGHLSYASAPLYAILHEPIYGQRSVHDHVRGAGRGGRQVSQARVAGHDVELPVPGAEPAEQGPRLEAKEC